MSNKVTIIILTKNEEKTIGKIIVKSKKYSKEIIVIDGCSTDKTRKISKKLNVQVYLDGGKGKGYAIRLGAKKARGNILVFIDADGSHDVRDIPQLIKPIVTLEADLVVASRGRGGSDELHGDFNKTLRLIGSAIITLVINLRFGSNITDSQNGFRAIRKDVINKIDLNEDIFTIEQEMVMKVLKNGYKISEIASHEYERKYGKSRIRLLTMSHKYIWCLLKNIF